MPKITGYSSSARRHWQPANDLSDSETGDLSPPQLGGCPTNLMEDLSSGSGPRPSPQPGRGLRQTEVPARPRPPPGEAPCPEYLTTAEAAVYLRVSKSFLDKARVYGGGPEFVRLGQRKIVYRKRDLDDWVRGQRFRSTSEYGKD